MILSDFKSLVATSVARAGLAYINSALDAADFNNLVQDCLNAYAQKTGVLQSDNVALTPRVGVSEYLTLNPATNDGTVIINGVPLRYLARPMCKVLYATINGTTLQIADGTGGYPAWVAPGAFNLYGTGDPRYGISSQAAVMKVLPSYLTNSPGQPIYVFEKAPNTLVFDRPFDQAYANSFLSGVLYHTPLTLSNGGDNQVLDFAPEDIRLAARYSVIELIRPYQWEIAVKMEAALMPEMRARMGEASSKGSGSTQRTSGVPQVTVDLST